MLALLAAVVLALVDLAQASLRETAPRVGAGDLAIAGLHLIALYAFVGLGAGVAIGLGAAALRRSRRFEAATLRLRSRRAWVRPDPRGWSRAVATLAVAGALFALVARAHVAFGEAFHRADLAGYVLGAMVLLAVPVLRGVGDALAAALRRVAFRIGPLASPLALAILLLGGAIAAVAIFLGAHPEVLQAYEPALLAWPAIASVLWALALAALGSRLGRARPRRVRVAAALLASLALAALGASATTFGGSNRVRSVVEQRSVLGRRVIRALAPLSDRDGDRYSWAFGGGDCDDSDPHVHPGAIDERGDGIDQDCFGGDGAPIVAPRGRGDFGRPVAGLPARPNFLVVTIDALRRDHLGHYGYERPTSPSIDRFAREAVDFAAVIPQSSRSLRSIPSMWSGNYPSEIAYGPEYLWPSLLPENVMAPELLRDRAGYQTSVVMATDYFERMDDFFQGFETVDQFDVPDPPRDRAVNEALPELRRLASSGSPWLLWVHLYNCHVPYLQDGIPSRYGEEQVDLYDTEIGFADQQLQRLLDALDELGLGESTVVVLASDHGEGFGEHGSFGHATTLYEEELRSVLMIRIPGVAPRRVEQLVGLLDVGPTLLNLARVSLTDDVSGVSLLPFATGERTPDPDRPLFAELLPDGLHPYDIKVMRRGSRKLMWWVRDGTYQYFDLSADPGEHHDLSDERRDEANAMLGELRAWVANASLAENRSDTFVDRNRLAAMPADVTNPVDIRYPGMFRVLGFDLPQTRFRRGETIPLTFFYRADAQIDRDLFFYVDIEGPPGVRIPAHFHAWHYPLHSRYPTTRWVPGEVIRDPTPIVIPDELTVPVRLRISLRVRDDARVLPGEVGGDELMSIPLTEIDVVPDGAPLVVSPPR